MAKEYSINDNDKLKSLQLPSLGYEILRHISLPDLLGEDSSFIQYYMGKSLARRFPLSTIDEILAFFENAGFGNLECIKVKKGEYTFQLSSALITERFTYKENVTYRLEAGFLAEQLSQIHKETYECLDEAKKRQDCILFYCIPSI
ncbi:YslB family protein [Salirhabdus sp. Marseille-P4669]|uniref:YslB family protein n=1 Tax=Salirhabdus sp. Marseille-P4669 TaxID=2042310 RepID=UPI000C7E4296|nr:YslB family protein [Salirhabdus sp. Marseille-P4669]